MGDESDLAIDPRDRLRQRPSSSESIGERPARRSFIRPSSSGGQKRGLGGDDDELRPLKSPDTPAGDDPEDDIPRPINDRRRGGSFRERTDGDSTLQDDGGDGDTLPGRTRPRRLAPIDTVCFQLLESTNTTIIIIETIALALF